MKKQKQSNQSIGQVIFVLWTLFSLWLLISCFFSMHLTALSYLTVYFAVPLLLSLCVGAAMKQPEMRTLSERINNILMCGLCGVAAVHALWRLFVPGDGNSTWTMPRAALDAACLYLLPLSVVTIVKLVGKKKDTSQNLRKVRLTIDATILGAMIATVLAFMAWLVATNVEVDLIVSCYAARIFLVILFGADTVLRIAAAGNKELSPALWDDTERSDCRKSVLAISSTLLQGNLFAQTLDNTVACNFESVYAHERPEDQLYDYKNPTKRAGQYTVMQT